MNDRISPHSGDLDSYDVKILNYLVKDGRMNWRGLSDKIGLSLTPTLRRVRRLEAAGIIEGYAALLNEARVMGGMSAFVTLTLEKQSEQTLDTFEEMIGQVPEVTSCFMTAGSADYLIRIVVRDLEHYQQVLRRLTGIPNIAHVNSSFALKTVVRRQGSIL